MSTNKFAAIILIHNQSSNLPRLITSYERQSSQPDLYVFVLDRCRDDSKQRLEKFAQRFPTKIVEVEIDSQFQAGYNRDLGLATAENVLGFCDVVFFDGDCVLGDKMIEKHKKVLSINPGYPTVSVGRRLSENAPGLVSMIEDQRFSSINAQGKVFTGGMDRLFIARSLANCRMITWSCNLGLNRKAINLIMRVNYALNRDLRVFNPVFDGAWGGEDDFIGIIAEFFAAAIVTIDPSVFVTHIWHVSRQNQHHAGSIVLKTKQVKALASRLNALGVTSARCADAPDDFNRAASSTSFELRNPILKFLLKNEPDFNKILLASALDGQIRWETSSTKFDNNVFDEIYHELRVKLADLQTVPVDSNILSELKYDWSWPDCSENRCEVCNSTGDFAGNGRCRACGCFGSYRIVSKVSKVEGRRLAVSPNCRTLIGPWEYVKPKQDLAKLPYDDGEFDVIFVDQTLEFVKNEFGVLRELRRVMKQTGQLFVSVNLTQNQNTSDLTERPNQRRSRELRYYGRDFAARMEQFGFDVETIQAWQVGILSTPADETVFKLSPRSERDQRSPSDLYLDVYEGCNFACVHCEFHKQKDRGNVPVASYKNIIEEFSALGGRALYFASGEALLAYDTVIELAKHARKFGVMPALVTNGSKIRTREIAEELISVMHGISMSMDSHVEAEHDSTRGIKGAFFMALSALELLKSSSKRIDVRASCVITKKNLAAFPSYVDSMFSHGFDAVSCTLLEPTFARSKMLGDRYYEENRLDDPKLALEVFKEAQRRGASITDQELAYMVQYAGNGKIEPGTCNSSLRNMIVNRDLSVKLCYSKDPIGRYETDGDLSKIWFGSRTISRRVEDRSCIRPCAISPCHRKSA